ncbi:leucine-rich repeat receptor-like serine/threonine-protein kinase At1g17230 [Hevea brasiliensis]|uniref:leucine-rich repeat receptor-like serine/threonine-protein kinase At1g17230 n=1 Tax=Hevea brasiliensis TaxID=3981 RepID=UPI0025CDC356|nr:leucine-rich repeat receptor-like serine/threonine-protein kinase At1g17230 [Hevea brasiliensis]
MSLAFNGLVRKIPAKLASLKELVTLFLGKNNLTGKIPQWKPFVPPTFLCGANNLVGSIPCNLYNISSIAALFAAQNQLHGKLPANIGLTLPNLQILQISLNQFYGSIPVSLMNASQLEIVDISFNSFTGAVPINLGDLNGRNQTSERIPADIGNLVNLYQLSIEENHFSCSIPISLWRLQKLEGLYLHSNKLLGQITPTTGPLPQEVGHLKNIGALDISENKLSGEIPVSIGERLKGEVPINAVFSDMTAFSLVGKKNLCGGIPELQLPACPIERKKHKNSPVVIILATIISSTELLQATQGFSSDKLNLQQHGAPKQRLKVVVLDFMVNGSLEMWLHANEDGISQSRNLNLLQRLRVAVDLSSTLHSTHVGAN